MWATGRKMWQQRGIEADQRRSAGPAEPPSFPQVLQFPSCNYSDFWGVNLKSLYCTHVHTRTRPHSSVSILKVFLLTLVPLWMAQIAPEPSPASPSSRFHLQRQRPQYVTQAFCANRRTRNWPVVGGAEKDVRGQFQVVVTEIAFVWRATDVEGNRSVESGPSRILQQSPISRGIFFGNWYTLYWIFSWL